MPANYTAEKASVDGVEIVRLTDLEQKIELSIVPSIGNTAYEMKVNGKNIFWSPYSSPAEFKAKPRHLGNPFMHPWANRLDHDGFYANGKHYSLSPDIKNFGRDPNGQPIHGLLLYSPHWQVTEVDADETGARTTSRLEFWKYPDLMAQFPFAHTVEMTHRLHDGMLEVVTTVRNLSAEAMPLSTGYHPYFRLHDSPRDQWKVRMPVRELVLLNEKLTPTGQSEPVTETAVALAGTQLDNVYTGLIRGESGRAEFAVEGQKEKISVLYGPKYTVAVIYAPAGRDFICFEPMSGPTNAFNLAHAGLYKELQTIPPGGTWQESFWVRPEGF
jgi:aldose 1-epimerase